MLERTLTHNGKYGPIGLKKADNISRCSIVFLVTLFSQPSSTYTQINGLTISILLLCLFVTLLMIYFHFTLYF